MKPRFSLRKLAKVRLLEHAARFTLGGLVSAAAAWVIQTFGPEIGGLFLAFPATLPATLTLIKQHDGRRAAFDDARGAAAGSVGLAGFTAVICVGLRHLSPAAVLSLATGTWFCVSVVLWRLMLKHPRPAVTQDPLAVAVPLRRARTPHRGAPLRGNGDWARPQEHEDPARDDEPKPAPSPVGVKIVWPLRADQRLRR